MRHKLCRSILAENDKDETWKLGSTVRQHPFAAHAHPMALDSEIEDIIRGAAVEDKQQQQSNFGRGNSVGSLVDAGVRERRRNVATPLWNGCKRRMKKRTRQIQTTVATRMINTKLNRNIRLFCFWGIESRFVILP